MSKKWKILDLNTIILEKKYKLLDGMCYPDFELEFYHIGTFRTSDDSTVRTGRYSTKDSNYLVCFLSIGTLTMNVLVNVDIFSGTGGKSAESGAYELILKAVVAFSITTKVLTMLIVVLVALA